MATVNSVRATCYKCNNDRTAYVCDGCKNSFCPKHRTEHQQELSQQMDNIGKQNDKFIQTLTQHNIDETLLAKINQWETQSITKIKSIAEEARADLKRLTDESKNRLIPLMSKLSRELRKSQADNALTEIDIRQCAKLLEELKKQLNTSSEIELLQKDDSLSLPLIMIKSNDKTKDNKNNLSSQNMSLSEDSSNNVTVPDSSSSDGYTTTNKTELSSTINTPLAPQSSSYPSMTFGLDSTSNKNIQRLFEYLMLLKPMDKNGPMNGRCAPQTDQMEQFLKRNFDFKNIPGEYIVQGVKSFQLGKSLQDMNLNALIHFPYNSQNSFQMTVKEILDWQRSYRVYVGKGIQGINKEFLYRALQGKSEDGEEAFRMKFVVRISTCPILMEFDANIISRTLNEDWPHRIKLVSVTGIDFAGRKHDEGDILYYVVNWKDVFEIDQRGNRPALLNDRDFRRKRNGPLGELHEQRLLNDLTNMARLRLRACDEEGVQIVVETGIGLGVFAGEYMGIDEKVQRTSAIATRTALEKDGDSYKNIRAVVFALPIFNQSGSNYDIPDAFHRFVEEFQEPQYNGRIPVLIADQDMHRLTVAIARHGFTVSELNPADSHGVFGEYWQNQGPAVEEKLALTTVGLLVQHHIINPNVLNARNYHII